MSLPGGYPVATVLCQEQGIIARELAMCVLMYAPGAVIYSYDQLRSMMMLRT